MMELNERHRSKRSISSLADSFMYNHNDAKDLKGESDIKSENGTDTKRTKRNRSSRACIVCRQRKVKCDAVKCYPKKCSNCVQFNIKNCVIPAPKKRKSKKLEELLKVNPDVELSNENDGDIEMNSQIFKSDMDIYPECVELDLQEKYPEMMSIYLDPKTALNQDLKKIEKYAESIDWFGGFPKKLLSSYIKEHAKNHGAPITIDNIDYDYLLRSGCFYLPPADDCWKYINSFFNFRFKKFPVLFEKHFREDYKDLKNPPSLLLLQSILYSGARFYDEPSWNDDQRRIQGEKADILFKRAKALYDKKIEPDNLCNLQSVLLLGNYRSRNKLEIRTDTSFIRSSLDLAYAIGIHKNFNSLVGVSSDDKKLFKKIWWTIFVYDTFYSFALCRPWAIDCIHTNHVPMIEPEDFRENIDDATTDNSSDVLYFIHSVKLSLCIRKICESISKISHSSKNVVNNTFSEYLDECDQMMTDWLEQLPTSALFRINSSSNNVLNASLSLEYYGALLLLHRIHILKNPNLKEDDASNYPSWGIVFKAAHMVAVISRYIIDNHHISFCQNLIPFVTSIAGSMMIYHLYNKDKIVHKIAKEDIETFLELLHKLSLDWSYASITYYSLKSIYEDKSKQSVMLNNLIRQSSRLNPATTALKTANLPAKTQPHEKFSPTKLTSIASITNISGTLSDSKTPNQIVKEFADLPVNSILYNTIPKIPDNLGYNTNNNMPTRNTFEGMKSSSHVLSPSNSTTSYISTAALSNKYKNDDNNNSNNNIPNSDTSCMPITSSLPKGHNYTNTRSPYSQGVSPTNSSYERTKNNNPESINMNISSQQRRLPAFINNVPNNSPNMDQPCSNPNLGYTNQINQANTKSYSNSISSSYDMLPPLLPLLPSAPNVQQSSSYSPGQLIPPNLSVPVQQPLPSQYPAEIPNIQEGLLANIEYNNQTRFNKNSINQSVFSRKFDLVMPPDLIPGVESFNWKPEFDTSKLTFTNDNQFDPNQEFDQFFQELGF